MKKLVLIVIGFILIGLAINIFLDNFKYSGKTTGIVVSATEEKVDKSITYYLIVKYKVNDKVIKKQSMKASSYIEEGSIVTVYYDKKNTNKFVLDKTLKTSQFVVGVCIIFFGIFFITKGYWFDEGKDSLIVSIFSILSILDPGPASTRLNR